jgi:predicted flap endonuclease-1-like 5' DNA nuclease
MVNTPMPDDIDLETFLRSAGQSFTEAQKALVPGADVSVNMMLSNAELELKVSVRSDANGKMSIRPISSDDISRGGIDPGMLSTVRVSFVSSIGEVGARPKSATPGGGAGTGTAVPILVGLTIDAAAALLKSRGWQFEAHAASGEEVSAAGKETRGRVLRQLPAGSQSVEKQKTTVHLWVNLGNVSVKEIDGIGAKLGDSLSRAGISTVAELGLASATQVASALRVNESRAQVFIDMASLMSRLAILGFRDQVAELLAKGAGVGSVEQLADADPTALFRVCRDAIASGKVRVPRGFTFAVDEVKGWIGTAASYLGR